MLRILGRGTKLCDTVTRRDALCVGGLSLFGGMTLPRVLEARETQSEIRPGRAKSVVLLNLLGGPPHVDMFDMKPDAPEPVRGEFKPIPTSLPGLQIASICRNARIMDRVSLIRTYSHQYNSHNPYNVFTGFDGGNDRDNYFAKRSDHPSMGSVCRYLGMGPTDVPPYVVMPAHPGHSQSLRRAGPYGGYLGSQYDPLITIWDDKKFKGEGKFYEPVPALGVPVLPALSSLPDITADRLDRRQSLLGQLDQRVAALETNPSVNSMSHYQQQVFGLLTSAKTRGAFDLTREPQSVLDRYGRHVWGSSMVIARRLVEAGSMFVSVNWEEANSGNHWDMHDNNFGMCRVLLPMLDEVVTALILDLEQRGLLDSTLVVVMGEMGGTPLVNRRGGRDHWPQCGFVLLAGGGTKRGFVLGRTDAHARHPVDRAVSAGDLVATIYHLLGVDPTTLVHDLTGRPFAIAHGGVPVTDLLA